MNATPKLPFLMLKPDDAAKDVAIVGSVAHNTSPDEEAGV